MDKHTVTYKAFDLDDKPVIKTFDSYDEAADWINDEIDHRVQYTVDHSPYLITEEERQQIEEHETSLVFITPC